MEDNFSQVALLYELSLTNVKHRNPEDIAGNFIRKILSRKALNYGAVWLKGTEKKGTVHFSSLYAMPLTWEAVETTREKVDELFKEGNLALTTESFFFGKELTGHFAYFRLLDIGILELYSSNDAEKLCEDSVYPLLDVVQQLAATIESGFAFKKLKDEIGHRKRAEKYQKNSEEKYRKIIDNIHLGLMEVDNDEKVPVCQRVIFKAYRI